MNTERQHESRLSTLVTVNLDRQACEIDLLQSMDSLISDLEVNQRLTRDRATAKVYWAFAEVERQDHLAKVTTK